MLRCAEKNDFRCVAFLEREVKKAEVNTFFAPLNIALINPFFDVICKAYKYGYTYVYRILCGTFL